MTVIFLLISLVIFLNGLTDAPNAIATCVSSGALSVKRAVILAGIFNFLGVSVMTVISPKVAETVFSLINIEAFMTEKNNAAIFTNTEDLTLQGSSLLLNTINICLIAALLSIILWTIITWFFGIPTSESHSLIASLTGSAFALCDSLKVINYEAWEKVLAGLLFSSIFGFMLSCIICLFFSFLSKYSVSQVRICSDGRKSISRTDFCTKYNSYETRIPSSCISHKKYSLHNTRITKRNDNRLKFAQIAAAAAMAFMHGAQDGQKFMALYLLAIFPKTMQFTENNYFSLPKVPLWIMLLSSVLMALGTFFGGGRIIKTVAVDMARLNYRNGFLADCSAFLCMLPASLLGIPLSTTHTKTCAILGAAFSASIYHNRNSNATKYKIAVETSCAMQKRQDAVNWHLAFDIVIAWLLTFPICILLGFIIAKSYLLFFL